MSKKVKGFKIDPNKNYKFKLVNPNGGEVIIPCKSTAWDMSENVVKTITLAKNFKSPYDEDQDGVVVVDDVGITFYKGEVIISGKEECKIKYLLAHDGNAEKGGNVAPSSRGLTHRWKLVDQEAIFKDELQLRKLKHDLEAKVLDASKEDLLEFLESVYGYKPKTDSIDELITEVLKKVQVTPQVVKDKFATRETKLKSKIIGLFKSGELVNTKGLVTWKDGGLEVNEFKVSEELKLVDSMIEWIAKGSKDAKAFEKKLASL